MTSEKSTLDKAFSRSRLYLALLLGLAISGWLFYSGMNKVEFGAVAPGTGTHEWVDSNNNGVPDHGIHSEFRKCKNGDYKRLSAWEVISAIKWTSSTFFWLFMALLGMVGRDLAYMWRIRILTHEELSWKSSFYVIMLWEFASALSPGVLSGAAVAMFILNRERIAMGRSTAIVIITAFFDNLFYVLLIPLVFLFVSSNRLFPDHTMHASAAATAFWIGFGIFSCLCLVLYLSIFRFPNLLKALLNGITNLPFLRRWNERANVVGEEVAATARLMRSESWGFWLKGFLATCCSWMSRYLVINFILQAFISLGLLQHMQVLAKQLILWMFLRISPTPGGSGVAEWAFSELLADLTTSAVLLAGMAVLWRLFSYFPYLFIGSILLPRWLKKTERR